MTITMNEHQKKQDQIDREVEENLAKLAGSTMSSGGAIEEYDGVKIRKPRGMATATLAKIAAEAAADEDREQEFFHVFPMARPWDGAHALHLTLMRQYGHAGSGITQRDFFGGSHPPQKIDVEVGIDEKGKTKSVQVPWGMFRFSRLEAVFTTDSMVDDDYGQVFVLRVTAPARKGPAIEGLFKLIEKTLETDSIYRGKYFVHGPKPKFLDPFKVDREKVVYNPKEASQLEGGIWGVIDTADLQREDGIPLNTKSLLSGDFGCGKTLAMAITAQVAISNGWTVVQTPPGADLDQVADTLRTAGLYAKNGKGAVALIEDVDGIAEPSDDAANEKLLELFDGIAVKENEVMIVMTTNHSADMHAGMHRPGRVDQTVIFDPPERETVERLIKVSVPDSKLDDNTDYEQVHSAMEGFGPAFIKETFISARRFAISRTKSRDYQLSTPDFVSAAGLLRPQWEQHKSAGTKPKQYTIEDRIRETFLEELDTRMVSYDDNRLVRVNNS